MYDFVLVYVVDAQQDLLEPVACCLLVDEPAALDSGQQFLAVDILANELEVVPIELVVDEFHDLGRLDFVQDLDFVDYVFNFHVVALSLTDFDCLYCHVQVGVFDFAVIHTPERALSQFLDNSILFQY